MKKPPSQVAPSQCRSLPRPAKDNHLCRNDKSFPTLDDRPERELPFHAPHGYHTEGELEEWVAEEVNEQRP